MPALTADDATSGLSPAAGSPSAAQDAGPEANDNEQTDKEKEQEVPLADNSQKVELRQRPLFDLFAGGVAGQNMVCK